MKLSENAPDKCDGRVSDKLDGLWCLLKRSETCFTPGDGRIRETQDSRFTTSCFVPETRKGVQQRQKFLMKSLDTSHVKKNKNIHR